MTLRPEPLERLVTAGAACSFQRQLLLSGVELAQLDDKAPETLVKVMKKDHILEPRHYQVKLWVIGRRQAAHG